MSPSIMPMVIVPLTFLFVLLIILIVKAPRAGAWVIGGLLLLAPVFLWRLAATGALAREEAIPLFVMPATFLFVLLVILMAKSPRAGIGLVIAIVVMAVLGLSFAPVVLHRASYAPTGDTIHSQWKEIVTEQGVERIQVWDDSPREYTQVPSAVATVQQASPVPAVSPSPIWSEGVDQEFEADVYPSSLAAAKALGRRMVQPIRTAAGDPNAEVRVVLFQENNERSLIAGFGHGMEQESPGMRYSIEADVRNMHPGEVGLTLRMDTAHQVITMVEGAAIEVINPQESTRMMATAFTLDRRTTAESRFIEKPWVESFGSFASARPNESLIIARSNGTCTSESEANQQALDDARARLTETLGRQEGRRFAEMARPGISTTDVLNGGFILDRFVQSFDGSAGKIWRQALLLDVSGPKLAQLARVKMHESRQVRESWARMGFSVIGVLVLIGAIYFFLNMATRGYYEWSLRIAGVVLAIVAIVSVLMIVQ